MFGDAEGLAISVARCTPSPGTERRCCPGAWANHSRCRRLGGKVNATVDGKIGRKSGNKLGQSAAEGPARLLRATIAMRNGEGRSLVRKSWGGSGAIVEGVEAIVRSEGGGDGNCGGSISSPRDSQLLAYSKRIERCFCITSERIGLACAIAPYSALRHGTVAGLLIIRDNTPDQCLHSIPPTPSDESRNLSIPRTSQCNCLPTPERTLTIPVNIRHFPTIQLLMSLQGDAFRIGPPSATPSATIKPKWGKPSTTDQPHHTNYQTPE